MRPRRSTPNPPSPGYGPSRSSTSSDRSRRPARSSTSATPIGRRWDTLNQPIPPRCPVIGTGIRPGTKRGTGHLLCTENDVFGADILNWLLPRLGRHELTVLLADKVPAKASSIPELVIQKTLERKVPLNRLFPLIDAQPLHGELLTFRGLAQRHGVSMEKVSNINDSASERRIRDFAPDVIVLARFSLILKANTLQIPRLGTYNIHPGALPGYAGLLAPMRGLLNGDTRLGCTLHQVDEGIDTGNIYSVSWLPAVPSRSVFGHIADLYRLGLVSLVSLLDPNQANGHAMSHRRM